MSLYFWIFAVFFKIGLFGFGGGYAIASLIEHETVDLHHWLTTAQFTDIMAISQATPGPIAINCATYVGYTATGSIWGAALATFAVSLPSLILVGLVIFVLARFRENPYVQAAMQVIKPCTLGLIAAAAVLLATPENFIDGYSYGLFGAALIASVLRINPLYLLVLGGLAGIFLY
ncbi:MAG: chromate transporter [Bacteroidales bacterium]|nr:chromate transporter [Bacteroidales bacterium]